MDSGKQQPVQIFIPEVEAFGGAERSVLALSRWLYEHGVSNVILTYEDRIGLAAFAGHPVSVLQMKPAGGARAKVAALKRHLGGRGKHPKLLCSGYQPALHATLAGARGFHCLMHDTPSLFGDEASRTFAHRMRIGFSNLLIGIGLRSGGATIVTSEYLKDECRRDFRTEAYIARMGGLPSKAGFRERPFTGTLHMLSVCRIEANKRIEWVLEALAALEQQQPSLSTLADWRLDLAGKGSLIDTLRTRADRLGIGPRVHFHGFVADEQLQELMAEAHLFLMPAVQGYGIPAVEAIQAGIPVLLHRESGVSDILLETPWATVFEGDAPEMIQPLHSAIQGVMNGRALGKPLPVIPTEEQWAERVASLCGWLA
ncbi:MAG: glycosyltransferase family 4 protein [Janthinobacterium lividum]